ncbi:NfeD family protein [Emcibacter sp.]|uniref:NfeD family protein n=1 Tax=Emcibacter sp. TaxID=1979954 RepID=UPI002AA83F37|nr:NfeD family protein [Emcibacter sp.]
MFEDIVFNHWLWFVTALALIGFEVAMPGVVFLWLAIASAIVGLIVLMAPDLAWEMQFVIFSVLAVVSVFAGRSYLKKHPLETEDTTLNRRGAQYLGHNYTLVSDMENGEGKIKIGDTLWKVSGEFDGKVGDIVQVTGSSGVILTVTEKKKHDKS